MRTVEDQLQAMLNSVEPIEPLDLTLVDARGCVLANDLTAAHPIPSFDAAAYDGYAVRNEDVVGASTASPVSLKVLDEVPAGFRAANALVEGGAIRVSVGALVPEGTGVIVPIALTELVVSAPVVPVAVVPVPTAETEESTEVEEAVATEVPAHQPAEALVRVIGLPKGDGIRKVGSQAAENDVVLAAGAVLDAKSAGVVAASGHSRVRVYPHARVVVITVGSELVDLGGELHEGQVHDVNAVTLVGAAESAGARGYRGGPARYEPADVAASLDDQLVRADLVVVAGGVTGEHGLAAGPTTRALQALGANDFEVVSIGADAVVGFGMLDDGKLPVITIPSDSRAALIAFEVFVRPIIRRLSGREELFRHVVRAKLTEALETLAGVRTFVPAAVSLRESAQAVEVIATPRMLDKDDLSVWPNDANSLIIVPETATTLQPGDLVAAIRLER